jgi:Transglycosylase SLT domain
MIPALTRAAIARRLRSRSPAARLAAAVVACLLALLAFVGLFAASAPPAPQTTLACAGAGGGGHGEVPSGYFPWLPEAAAKYHLGPRGASIIAAIHYVESDWDRSPLPGVAAGTLNYMGAEGPGQFLVSSWATYGVDADGDGVKDPYSIPDSVFATARLLRADGAPADWRDAIFAYNHAWWYVHEVLAKASSLHLASTCTVVTDPTGPVPSGRLARLEYVAKWIQSRRIHYCWAGGHVAEPGPSPGIYCWSASDEKVFGATEYGLDCSGAVRWLLVLSGFPDPGPLVSNELGAHYPSGPGREVTIWSNVDHVWIELDGRAWGTADSNFAHGPGFGPQDTEGFEPSHPPGL